MTKNMNPKIFFSLEENNTKRQKAALGCPMSHFAKQKRPEAFAPAFLNSDTNYIRLLFLDFVVSILWIEVSPFVGPVCG
jgi:hypothetical protein